MLRSKESKTSQREKVPDNSSMFQNFRVCLHASLYRLLHAKTILLSKDNASVTLPVALRLQFDLA